MPRFSIDLPRDMLTRLQAYAREQHRTPRAQAEWLLIQTLNAWAEAQAPRGTLGQGQGVEYPRRFDALLASDAGAGMLAIQACVETEDTGG